MLAVDACSGASTVRDKLTTTLRSSEASTSTTIRAPKRRTAGERPEPLRPEGTYLIPQIEHVVVVMQENHSYDSYFGMLARGDGFTLDHDGRPTATTVDTAGKPVRAFRMNTTCQTDGLTQNWNSSHVQWNDGAMDGFARTTPASMGYWDRSHIPFYYSLAETFPLCDRWFGSCLGQTYPNRRFLLCGSALGTVSTVLQDDVPDPAHGTIVDALNRNNIEWRDYYTTLPTLFLFPKVFGRNQDHCPKIEQFFKDAASGSLPAVSFVEGNGNTQSEEAPQDLSVGEAFSAKVINAVMASPNWPKTVLLFCYDEHGGYYDHVPPPVAVAPDNIEPSTTVHPGEHTNGLGHFLPGDYKRYGMRVPGIVVSPYAKRNYVSHVVRDHTAILSLIEHIWNLPALSNRDGAADNLLDTLDLTAPPTFLIPPKLAAPSNATGLAHC